MTRVPALSALIALLSLAAGCAVKPSVPTQRAASEVGLPAADIAYSRALEYQDLVDGILVERNALVSQRDRMRADARNYRRLAGGLTYSRFHTTLEREAYAAHYRAIAEEREVSARQCQDLVDAFDTRLIILRNSKRNQIVSARTYEGLRVTVRP